MAKRSPNPNTSYGRKRISNEYQQRVSNMNPSERTKHESNVKDVTVWLWMIVIVICVIAFLVGGTSGLIGTMKFMTNQ
ncbi:hypothetical protein [Pedobacter gandavensis]|uniref:hypothetical protein n=1 Tax=Pedobacter gandavensis TaxID=2679963 RepID=UPI00292FE844|nr:hypothetical protein [Pedobacter gandavensis]